jgi:hypothetical protein
MGPGSRPGRHHHIELSAVGWVEPFAKPIACAVCNRWVSLRSTHPTRCYRAALTRRPGLEPGPIATDACCKQNCCSRFAYFDIRGYGSRLEAGTTRYDAATPAHFLIQFSNSRFRHCDPLARNDVSNRDTHPHSRGAKRPSDARFVRPENRGRGNAGRLVRPQPRVVYSKYAR